MDEKKEKIDVKMVTDILTDAEAAFVATSDGIFFHGNVPEILTCLSVGVKDLVEQGVPTKVIMRSVKLGATIGEIFEDTDKKEEKEEE